MSSETPAKHVMFLVEILTNFVADLPCLIACSPAWSMLHTAFLFIQRMFVRSLVLQLSMHICQR